MSLWVVKSDHQACEHGHQWVGELPGKSRFASLTNRSGWTERNVRTVRRHGLACSKALAIKPVCISKFLLWFTILPFEGIFAQTLFEIGGYISKIAIIFCASLGELPYIKSDYVRWAFGTLDPLYSRIDTAVLKTNMHAEERGPFNSISETARIHSLEFGIDHYKNPPCTSRQNR